jgi:hypothetical protein
MRMHLKRILSATAFSALAAVAEMAARPPTECEAPVGYDRDRVLAATSCRTSAGARTCIPFTTVAAHPPPGYKGDFYVDEFSDERPARPMDEVQAGQGVPRTR